MLDSTAGEYMIVLAFAAWFVIYAGALVTMILLPLAVVAVVGAAGVVAIKGWLGGR